MTQPVPLKKTLHSAVIFDIKCTSGSRMGLFQQAGRDSGRGAIRDWLLLAVKTTSGTFRDKVPHSISDMPRASSFSFTGFGNMRCDGQCEFIQNHSKKDLTDHQPQQEDSAESQYAAELAAMIGPPPSEPSGSKAKDVFTFVRPVEYYSRLLKVAHSLGPVGTPETLLIIQTTGCPSCALAAVHTFDP